MIDLDALERLLAEATPGPWTHDTPYYGSHVDSVAHYRTATFDPNQADGVGTFSNGPDAALIVLLRNTAPALIQEVRRLREAEREAGWLVRKLRAQVRYLVDPTLTRNGRAPEVMEAADAWLASRRAPSGGKERG